jgi:hypothetical protein
MFLLSYVAFRISYKTNILPVVLYSSETPTLRRGRLKVFENRVLRRIFGPKKDEVHRLCGLVRFLATDSEVRVRFPVLADFLRSNRFGTASTQLREKLSSYLKEKVAAPV